MMETEEETPSSSPPEAAEEQVEEEVRRSTGGYDIDDDSDEEMDRQHSLPNPEELNYVRSGGVSDGWTVAILFVLMSLILAMVIGLSVGLTADNREQNKSNGGYSGSSALSDKKRMEQAMDYMLSNGVNTIEDFENTISPQYKAIQFIAIKDKRRMTIPKAGITTDEGYALLTRYVLAIIYYATQGQSWSYDMLFLSDHDTCEWFEFFPGSLGQVGVLCNQHSHKITGLSFINNNLKGQLPKEIGQLTTIEYLESIGNDISGIIPEEVANMKDLRTLVMARGKLSGPLPDWMSTLKQLEFLYLSNNEFSGTVPISWGNNLIKLAVLALDDNQLVGSLETVWQFSNMEYLYLEDNEFSGKLPDNLKTVMPLLINFDISTNDLSGPIPADLLELPNLQIIDLHDNLLTGPLPNIPENTALQFLALHNNVLSSSIPSSIGNLHKLTHLDLATNQLVGDIPNTLSRMESLRYLFLSSNPFTAGTIPAFIYDFELLEEVSLKATQRTGKLSHLMGFLSNLILFDLDNNQLTGTIPTQIKSMQKLQFLLLNRNLLTGDVPTELGDLPDLRVFFLDRNSLTGKLDGPCSSANIEMAVADCQEVNCPCCNPCCTDGDENSCVDSNLVANISPAWELGYGRQFFDFSATEDVVGVGDDDVLENAGEP